MIAHAKIKSDTIDVGVLEQLHGSGFLPKVWVLDELTQGRNPAYFIDTKTASS